MRGDWIVDRARADDDEQARIVTVEDPAHGLATPVHEVLGRLGQGQGQIALDRLGRGEQFARDDVDVLESFLHGRAQWGRHGPKPAHSTRFGYGKTQAGTWRQPCSNSTSSGFQSGSNDVTSDQNRLEWFMCRRWQSSWIMR